MTMKLDAMMSQHQLNTSCGDMDASVYSAITEASEMTTKHSNSKHVPASLHKDTARTMQTSTTHTFHSFFNQSASSFCSDDDDEDDDEGSEGSIDMYDESEDNIHDNAVEAASITYMGRNYEASEFLNATQVLEESFRGVRSNRRMNDNGFNNSASELLLGKWALLKGGDNNNDNNNQKARDMAMSTASMGFTASEHLSDRWARLEEQEADEEEELGSDSDHSCDIPAAVISSSPPKRDLHSSFTALFGGHNLMSATSSNEQKAEVTSEKQQRRANRRRKNHSGGKKKLPPKSKSLTGSSKVSLAERTLSNSSSSSRGIPARPRGHGSCSNLRLQQEMNLSLSDHSSMRNSSFRTTGGSTRSTNHESFIHKVFGIQGGLSAEELEQQEWTEKGLQRWGYTNTDVVNIVKDDETFAKLKRNLRNRKAVTNSLVVQRLHVFVKNQKQKHKKAAAAIMQKQ